MIGDDKKEDFQSILTSSHFNVPGNTGFMCEFILSVNSVNRMICSNVQKL